MLLVGCVDAFHGSNVQFDFSPGMPTQVSPGLMPTSAQLPNNIHFTLYAYDEGTDASGAMVGRLYELQRFEIHRIVDLTSPCFIDVGERVPHPGLHVSQYAKVIGEDTGIPDITMPPASATEQQKIIAATAVQRDLDVKALAGDMGLNVVASASTAVYPAVAASCADTSGIPPPDCTDADANQRRLDACQAFWTSNPDYFEGTDRVLTAPLSGTTHGMVDGTNPINLAPVGGAQFFVPQALEGFPGFAVYWQYDDANGDGQPDYPPSVPVADQHEAGTLFLFGKPTTPTRGVMHVHMTSLVTPTVFADVAIFANLDQDNVSF